MASFIKDIEEIRQRAINKIEDGPVTATYKGDKERTVEILNEALATEIVCVLRYMHHYFMATGVHGRAVADEFKEHADEEREHADEIAERIQQLGGKPDLNPGSLVQRSVAQYVEGETLADMIREDLIAERTVIEVYQQMIRYFGNDDPTTRRLIEHILAEEEEHAADLSDLLYVVDPQSGETKGRDPGTTPLELGGRQHEIENEGSEHEQRLDRPDQVAGRDREYDGTQQLPQHTASDREQGSTRNREQAIGDLAGSGASQRNLKRGRDMQEARGNPAQSQVSSEARDTRREQQGRSGKVGESRPARDRGTSKRAEPEPFAGRGTVKAPASNIGGVGGRTMNRRRNETGDIDTDEVAERPNRGASSGGTRSPRILQKNRKSKRAA